jgi:regulator of sigma E protease
MRAEQGPCKLVFVHPVPTTEKAFSLFVGTKREAVLPRCAAAVDSEITSAEAVLWEVTPGSPMAKAGLQRGDRIVSFEGRPVREFRSLEIAMQEKPDQAYRLSYARAGAVTETTVTPTSAWTAGELNVKTLEVAIGGATREGVDAGPMRDYTTGERLNAATIGAVTEVFSMTRSMAVGVFDLFTFQSDPSSLGGPMMMADFASRSAREGLAAFLFMMANISISLAMVNLVPIPGLDGGHILIGGVEAAMRRPLSFKARQIVSYAGVVAVVSLMAFAMVNDLKRYWDSFAHWLAS